MSSHTERTSSPPPQRPQPMRTQPMRNERAIRAARRAKLAPYLSWGLLLAGIVVFAVFLFQAGLFQVFFAKAPPPPPAVANPEQIAGQFSRMSGFDRQKQPYEITARSGIQDKANPDIVHLEGMTSKFQKDTSESYSISANTGTYNVKSKELLLSGNVTISSPGRYDAVMDKATVNTNTKAIRSDSPVVVDMPSGQIKANGLEIGNDGHNIMFKNRVKARFGGNEQSKQGLGGQ